MKKEITEIEFNKLFEIYPMLAILMRDAKNTNLEEYLKSLPTELLHPYSEHEKKDEGQEDLIFEDLFSTTVLLEELASGKGIKQELVFKEIKKLQLLLVSEMFRRLGIVKLNWDNKNKWGKWISIENILIDLKKTKNGWTGRVAPAPDFRDEWLKNRRT